MSLLHWYLIKSRVFLSQKYQLKAVLQNFDDPKTNISLIKVKFRWLISLISYYIKNVNFLWGNCQTDVPKTLNVHHFSKKVIDNWQFKFTAHRFELAGDRSLNKNVEIL